MISFLSTIRLLPVLFFMLTGITGCAGVVVAGATATASSVSDPRTLGTQIDDQSIELQAAKLIVDDKQLVHSSRIIAVSNNGRVLLIGQAPTQALINHAEKLISTIPGITLLYNEIRIGEPISLGSQSSDSWLTTKVKVKLYDSPAIPMGKIKVITENSEVFLVGIANTTEAKAAVEIARNVKGVRKVIKVFELANSQ